MIRLAMCSFGDNDKPCFQKRMVTQMLGGPMRVRSLGQCFLVGQLSGLSQCVCSLGWQSRAMVKPVVPVLYHTAYLAAITILALA